MNSPASPPSAASLPNGVLDVCSIGFTPIKGTRHQSQPEASFDEHGPVGDRRYCLVDTDTRRVLRTVQNPSLVAVVAAFHGAQLETSLPDGRSVCTVPEASGQTLTCDYWGRPVAAELMQGPHDALLSSWLGKPVRLAHVPRGDVVFGEPITIVTTASIRDLGERLGHPDLLAEAARFRATLLVETDVPYIEGTWNGREMIFGEIRIRVGGPIPRCAVMDLHPVTGARGSRLLTSLAAYRPRNDAGEPHFGVYGQVIDAPRS
ncbi:MOSC domain-containing protein [Brevibacterium sp. UCMA 11752]|uniref:MOSC domain-containing protein n=1 Tax=Brevibacterium sp. UCMA 11752 TaxID=2745946 RepID=UPI001F44E06A|nr:MOSC N-terminal beta barrel domain-containing protein [Brevibacterium sp. UCMA 11752]MCF2586224.1 MOSC domain-containing protein [Brevibacterium sp. UCMA 11752]